MIGLLPEILSAASILGVGAFVASCVTTSKPTTLTLAQIIADAPLELRPAVAVLADPLQTNLMLQALGLGSPETGFPPLESYDYTRHGIEADFLMLAGQSRKKWSNEDTRDAFAQVLAVPKVTVSSPAPGVVRLQLRVFDTLAAPAALPGWVSNDVDLKAVPAGLTEDGEGVRIPVLYTHGLGAGLTGSGKGSIIWSLVAGLAPAIRAGLVDLYGIDPKGGVEFGPGRELFVRFAYQSPEDILALLEEVVALMRERQAKLMKAKLRKHTPTTDEPLILLLIDEFAALSAYTEPKMKARLDELLGLLLTQARATAISVFAFIQDPSKENMPQRQLFPLRMGLRLAEPTQVGMVFGAGARDRGAECDEISPMTPGVGYIEQDGSRELNRVRFFMVTDDDIAAMVDQFAPRHETATTATESDDEETFDPSTFDPDDLGDGEGAVAA
ncbi:FtsK/SpoIIIE domain-containing protein [Nocardia brasiliensis]|uniref:FtsK/SpoIIIE domain-containing protein n=1 Tax=Nocardia brasiliensis TaxID=37326 RepID=UPI002455402E|nr:FtsK/SpoIIIE domain-containing protein [Nocardia brasiliensis]